MGSNELGGELLRSLDLILPKLTFDDQAEQVLLHRPDPRPRRATEELHEIVSIERALERLDVLPCEEFRRSLLELVDTLDGRLHLPRPARRYVGSGESEHDIEIVVDLSD